MEEYNYAKAEMKRAKLAITKWVKQFREENNNRNPDDSNTQPIAFELHDYNHAN